MPMLCGLLSASIIYSASLRRRSKIYRSRYLLPECCLKLAGEGHRPGGEMYHGCCSLLSNLKLLRGWSVPDTGQGGEGVDHCFFAFLLSLREIFIIRRVPCCHSFNASPGAGDICGDEMIQRSVPQVRPLDHHHQNHDYLRPTERRSGRCVPFRSVP